MRKGLSIVFLLLVFHTALFSQQEKVRVLAITSKAKDHQKMIACAADFFERMGAAHSFEVLMTDDTSLVNDESLSKYQVFVQLHEAPFDMSTPQQDALRRFVEQGNGWVGIHAAGLTGVMFKSPGRVYWQWFEDFLGGVEYSPHPALQKGTVTVEDSGHPVMAGLPARFEVVDEWYEFNESPRRSPRGKVRVLAVADESTYTQRKPMGDHPIIWTNEAFERMVYIGIGHDASMCSDPNYERLVANAIKWAAGRE